MKLYKSDMSATSRPKLNAVIITMALFSEISVFLHLSVTGFWIKIKQDLLALKLRW